ncbi:MAG TPA: amidohydrolase family protein [Bacteroidota bacterium]|nr:amidohydrolase family protein [Bacteroidota bacterium]
MIMLLKSLLAACASSAKAQHFGILVTIFLLCTLTARAQHTDTLSYNVVRGKDISGYQKIWNSGPHEFYSCYSYNDRGRGDSVLTHVTTNDSGLTVHLETNGVDYYKRPYRELFAIKQDSALMVINEDRKVKYFRGELFQSAEPTDVEPVLHYFIGHPNVKIPLATGGTIMAAPLHDKTVSFGGKVLHLFLCEYYFNENNPPNFAWLDADRHFFAYASDFLSTIRVGYEPLVDTLVNLQLAQAKGYYGRQMKALSDSVPSRLAICHVRLFDSENARMLQDMTVTIENGRVKEVGKSSSVSIPDGYTIIDGTNKTLMPGLWDMHDHFQESEGLNYLAGGVTHVRDMGNGNRLPAVRDAIRNNELLAPDISYMSGFIDQEGPYQGPTGTMIHNVDEGLQAVDTYAHRGYQQIKLYSSIDPKWVAPLAAEAHKLGLHVAGHVPSFSIAEQAVRSGYDEITHMNMVMLNFQGDTIDTRTMLRFSVVGERGKDLDLNSAPVNAFIRLLQERHISLDPTMNVFAGMLTVFPGDTDASIKPIVGWMPADERDNIVTKSSFAPASERDTYDASFARMMEMLKKLYDSGILIVAGTDGGAAFALEHELEIYVQAGIPPLKALQCATYNAAKDCKLLDDYGIIRAGKAADLILVDGDPGSNISDIRRVEWAIKNGLRFDPKKLLASIGWSYYH